MRQEAIEMVFSHVPQSREAPLHRGSVLGALGKQTNKKKMKTNVQFNVTIKSDQNPTLELI